MEDKKLNTVLNEKKWSERAETFEKQWFNRFNFFQFLQKRVIALLYLRPGQRFLDVGCGTGWAVRYAGSIVRNRGEFYGIDISPGMIDKAKENCGDRENIHFYKSDAEKLPFADDFFDFIICTNSFHHYFNPLRVLTEVYRVLKPGGKFFLLDATGDGPVKILDIWMRKTDRSHVKLYSTREFRTLFTRAGLNYLSSRPISIFLNPMKVHTGSKG